MLCPHTPAIVMFKIVQVNLDRSKLATAEIRHYCEKESVDVACLQEPYTFKGKLVNMPVSVVAILPNDPTPMVAVVIFNRNIDALTHLRYADKWTLCVDVSRGNYKVTIVNIYCQFSLPREIFVQKIDNIMNGMQMNNTIILGDFNAKSPLWHCTNADENGEKFEELIEQHNLTVINREGQPLTYMGRAGAGSNIDVTLAKGNICNRICNWSVDEHATSSAHNVVRFDVNDEEDKLNYEISNEDNTYNYNINKLNKKKFIDNLVLPQINRNCDLQKLTLELEEAIWRAIENSTPKKKQTNDKRKPFWTESLNRLKRKMKASRKSYRAAGDHALRSARLQTYRRIKQQFETELKETKKKTWSKFIEENLQQDLWGMPYKIIMSKIKTKSAMNTLKDDSGQFTTNWKDTIELFYQKLFPDDRIEDDNEDNTRIRNKAKEVPSNENDNPDDLLVTNDQVMEALKKLKLRKAPGPDQIKNEIFRNNVDIWTPYLTRLFNECIEQSIFPKPWKVANLVIFLKSEDKDKLNPKSYRPICLLNTISKIFEKILAIKINKKRDNLENCKLQYGFRPKKIYRGCYQRIV